MTNKSTHSFWHYSSVSRIGREVLHAHKSAIILFTGLSDSGKSTLAHALEDYLYK